MKKKIRDRLKRDSVHYSLAVGQGNRSSYATMLRGEEERRGDAFTRAIFACYTRCRNRRFS